MKQKTLHICIAYGFHVILMILGFFLMRREHEMMDVLLIAGGVLYLIYWCIVNRKQFLSWAVYLHFVIGTALQITLNSAGIIPPDNGFFSGMGQAVYVVLVCLLGLLAGIVNLILWLIDKRRRKRSAAAPEG
ncbi:MAG: hypothetical protein IK134_13475 [Oscillospiraceae bacterium]|nr:hypothetical protein [Oscillospiraceae bacterium]